MLCQALELGLCATGFASAGRQYTTLRYTGTASGTPNLSTESALAEELRLAGVPCATNRDGASPDGQAGTLALRVMRENWRIKSTAKSSTQIGVKDRTQNNFALNPRPHGRGQVRVNKIGKLFCVRS